MSKANLLSESNQLVSNFAMKFGVFYEHQLPRPWQEDDEHRLYHETLDQVALADRLGFDYVWAVEHHFLEEYSHLSAPEIFLAACAQRTSTIRIGHGVTIMVPQFNHPARVAERIASLDLLSSGRVEWGTGESSSRVELEGFGVSPIDKKAMWREATEQACEMLSKTPYPGFEGRYFTMPARNVLPKPLQKPHPPLWLACGSKESIRQAARSGMGALCFHFLSLDQAQELSRLYYDTLKSEECVPIGQTVNANFATVAGFACHDQPGRAEELLVPEFEFFHYSLSHYYMQGRHVPAETDIYRKFERTRESYPKPVNLFERAPVGTPAQVEAYLDRLSEVGVDQTIFIQQAGRAKHQDICDSLTLFAEKVLPKFKFAAMERESLKAFELAPYIEAALERKKKASPAGATAVESITAYGAMGDRPIAP